MGNNIAIPDEMLSAAWRAVGARMKKCVEEGKGNSLAELHVARIALEAALEWLSDNPIPPSLAEVKEFHSPEMWHLSYHGQMQEACVRWQRRMFIAPESNVPEEIKTLLWISPENICIHLTADYLNQTILDAFNRGKRVGANEGKK